MAKTSELTLREALASGTGDPRMTELAQTLPKPFGIAEHPLALQNLSRLVHHRDL